MCYDRGNQCIVEDGVCVYFQDGCVDITLTEKPKLLSTLFKYDVICC